MSDNSSSTREEIDEMMESRFSVYQLLARLWINEVDEALWEGLQSVSLPHIPENQSLNRAYRELENYLKTSAPQALKELAIDYAILCRGVNPHKGADPYESVHRNSLGLLMQDEWEEVLRFYREVGLERTSDAVEPEDHLGIELECMARLCNHALAASRTSDDDAFRTSLRYQLRLLEDHLLLWVPGFCEAVIESAKTDFYKSVATITNEYIVMDREYVLEQLG